MMTQTTRIKLNNVSDFVITTEITYDNINWKISFILNDDNETVRRVVVYKNQKENHLFGNGEWDTLLVEYVGYHQFKDDDKMYVHEAFYHIGSLYFDKLIDIPPVKKIESLIKAFDIDLRARRMYP